jgi:hypothetical protein
MLTESAVWLPRLKTRSGEVLLQKTRLLSNAFRESVGRVQGFRQDILNIVYAFCTRAWRLEVIPQVAWAARRVSRVGGAVDFSHQWASVPRERSHADGRSAMWSVGLLVFLLWRSRLRAMIANESF